MFPLCYAHKSFRDKDESYELTTLLDIGGFYSWYTYAKTVASELEIDFELIHDCENLKQTQSLRI